MWRSLFLAIGICMIILGVECLMIDKAVLSAAEPAPGAVTSTPNRVVKPYEWAPWSLLSGGTIIIIYSFAIPRRVNGD
ncbi:MAG: hypothetical protein ACI9HK_001395 [Pirellulaceae bacterium]|jgi:hypothetical protein